MGQQSNDAAVKDAQIKSSKEEYALSMGQSSNNDAAAIVKGGMCRRHGAKVKYSRGSKNVDHTTKSQ